MNVRVILAGGVVLLAACSSPDASKDEPASIPLPTTRTTTTAKTTVETAAVVVQQDAPAQPPPQAAQAPAPRPQPEEPHPVIQLPRPPAGGDEIANDDWVIPKGGFHGVPLEISAAETPVHIEIAGVKDADKGFTVLVAPTADFDACAATPSGCHSAPVYSPGVLSFDRTVKLPKGSWTIGVVNSENLLKRLTAHVHVVRNPGA